MSLVMLSLAGLMPGPVLADVAANGTPSEIPAIVESAVTVGGETSLVVDNVQQQAVSPSQVTPPEQEQADSEPEKRLSQLGEGMASYYGAELAGNRTASGERFNPSALTAAHRTLPMGTKIRVTNKANGKSVVVRVNDRGPFAKNRIIDVSRGAAEKISMVRSGTARVTLERIS